MTRRLAALALLAALTGLITDPAAADGPKDNLPDNVRPIPPPGIAVPPNERAELQAGVDELGKEIEALRNELKSKPALLALLPDVQIFHNSVRYALTYYEFYDPKEFAVAKRHLQLGRERADELRHGCLGRVLLFAEKLDRPRRDVRTICCLELL